MSARIFINYRRDDDPSSAARVGEALTAKFGKSNIFMDVDNLLAGQRFDVELSKALAQCDVLIATIGPRWMDLLKSRAASGERDYVREEIAEALKRGIVVIPTRVGREGQLPPLPRPHDLPEDIRDLVLYQKHDVAYERFGRDIGELIEAITSVLNLALSADTSGQDPKTTPGHTSSHGPALTIAAKEWEQLKDSTDISKIGRFAKYFSGYYSDLALERVEHLERAEAATKQAEAELLASKERADEERRAAKERAEAESRMRALEQRAREDRVAAWRRLRAVRSPADLLRLSEHDVELLGIDLDAQPVFAVWKSTGNLEEIDGQVIGTAEQRARDIESDDVRAALNEAFNNIFSTWQSGTLQSIAAKRLAILSSALASAQTGPAFSILQKMHEVYGAILAGEPALAALIASPILNRAQRDQLELTIQTQRNEDAKQADRQKWNARIAWSLLIVCAPLAIVTSASIHFLVGAPIRSALSGQISETGIFFATFLTAIFAPITAAVFLFSIFRLGSKVLQSTFLGALLTIATYLIVGRRIEGMLTAYWLTDGLATFVAGTVCIAIATAACRLIMKPLESDDELPGPLIGSPSIAILFFLTMGSLIESIVLTVGIGPSGGTIIAVLASGMVGIAAFFVLVWAVD